MKRTLIIGSPGAGKSTFAIQLSKKTGLPLIHLDSEFWQPGWVQTPSNEWREHVSELVSGKEWIIDGSYDGSLDIRLPRADTVIYLDFPRRLCMWRVFKRIFTSYGKVRQDMAEGCPEHLDFEFIKWVWDYPHKHTPKIQEKLDEYFSNGNLFRLNNSDQVKQFLASL